jgi:hypothetical protein
VLSINAAISAAVVLASRLHEDLAVFALMLFSVEAFALFPVLRRRLQVRSIPFAETGANDKQSSPRLLHFRRLLPGHLGWPHWQRHYLGFVRRCW